MIYLDSGATSFHKPPQVMKAVEMAMRTCASPGRGGYEQAQQAARIVYDCREQAARMFSCRPEQVAFTMNCTHGLNIAINTLVNPGDPVVISGFEHNAVTRPLHARKAEVNVAGRKLFDWQNTLEEFENALKKHPKAAIFTHVSNVFGYILPVEEMAQLCRQYDVPFILDAAQSAGTIPVDMKKLGADFIAMPGHKGLLGPQGTGILLCGRDPKPLMMGGTGSDSIQQEMPDYLPERLEAGTVNVPGIAGLRAGLRFLHSQGVEKIGEREHRQLETCVAGLRKMGISCYAGPHQAATVSILPKMDCEELAALLAKRNIAVRAGLHCAPLAHESAGTIATGTVRISFGFDANSYQTGEFLRILQQIGGGDL